MHLVSRHDQSTCMNYNLLFSGARQIWLHGFEPANFFFSLSCLCTSSSQPISFFFHNFIWFVFGFRHDLAYFKEDHSKSKVLGCMTTQHFNSCRYDMLMRVWGNKLWPYMLQSGLTSKPSEVLTTSTHWKRGRRWEGVVPKATCPRLLDTSLCF